MNTSRVPILLVGDVACFVLAFIIMVIAENSGLPTTARLIFYTNAFIIPLLITLFICYILNLYNIERSVSTPRNMGLFAVSAMLSGGVIAVFFYIFSGFGITPKTNLLIIAVSFFTLQIGWRRLFYKLFSRALTRKVFFIGESEEIEKLKIAFIEHPQIGKTIGSAKTFSEYYENQIAADLIVIDRVLGIQDVARAAKLQTPISTIQLAFEDLFGRVPLSHFSPEEAFALLEAIAQKKRFFLYRFIEILFAVLLIIITLPITLLAAVLIFIEDGGPILLQQERVGKKGGIFKLYKFRSMKALSPDGSAEIAGKPQWADKNDLRITFVGKILRKTHIDEIPQMINIIKGNLALVGPRPERPEFVASLEKEIPFYFLRHTVKPGFTGWAQIKFHYARSVDGSKEKFEYDLYYLKNYRLLLDLGIVAKTIQIIFTH